MIDEMEGLLQKLAVAFPDELDGPERWDPGVCWRIFTEAEDRWKRRKSQETLDAEARQKVEHALENAVGDILQRFGRRYGDEPVRAAMITAMQAYVRAMAPAQGEPRAAD